MKRYMKIDIPEYKSTSTLLESYLNKFKSGGKLAPFEWRLLMDDYLKSESWSARQTAIYEREGGMCRRCRKEPIDHVHHLTYKHSFAEPLSELLGVCAPCHKKITERKQELAVYQSVNSAGVERPCKACGVPIRFVGNRNGGLTPLTKEGKNHFLDCPQANEFGRGR
jgi:hypothetical protein